MDHDQPVHLSETANLEEQARREGQTPVGYFLGKAAAAATRKERDYWLGRVDGARYMQARQESRDAFAETVRQNMEAHARLVATEASLELVRTVGNAAVLRLVAGEREAPAYYLVRRLQGETGTEGYGAPRGGQWVATGLRRDAVHEFRAVSHSAEGPYVELSGPWLAVEIGTATTAEVQARQREEAERELQETRERIAAKARRIADERAAQRAAREEALERQREEAAADRERRERERIRQEEEHARAVENMPLVAPRELSVRIRDVGHPQTVFLDLRWRRGPRMAKLFQTALNGSVLGYSGEYDGAKPLTHVYERTVEVPRGQRSTVEVYAVTPHDTPETEEIRTVRSIVDVPEATAPPAAAPPAERLLVSDEIGGGRFGFASRTWAYYGVTEAAGSLEGAAEAGVLALFEAAPGDGAGTLWVVTDGRLVSWVTIAGERVRLMRYSPELYRAAGPVPWPSRLDRLVGVPVSVE